MVFKFLNRDSLIRMAWPLLPIAVNLLVVYLCYVVCDIAYYLYNYEVLAPIPDGGLWDIATGFLRFATTAIMYTNVLWIVMHLLQPGPRRWHKWLFVVVNSVCVAVNLADATYFPFTGRRTTCTVFQEFANENNLVGVVLSQMMSSWYLVLLWIALTYLLCRAYKSMGRWQWSGIPLLLCIAPFVVFGMRGGIGADVRPITMSNATQYVHEAKHCSLVLNTPFSMLRSIGKAVYKDPGYMSADEMDALFNPVQSISCDGAMYGDSIHRRNVVLIILESFGKEYVEQGYAPFLDSLARHSLSFEYALSNGRKSIDAMPCALAAIPMFVEPFVLTPYSMNDYKGLAGYLADMGYATAFYHGAPIGSMGFIGMTRKCGFTDYYGMEDYQQATGRDDFDGRWAVWDDKFLPYFADGIDQLPQPFIAGVFTASSHHPFHIPPGTERLYPEGPLEMHKCIRYVDDALRQFFNKVKRTDWYANTLFVIMADHTNMTCVDKFQTSMGQHRIPLVFHAPGDSTMVGRNTEMVTQQTDVMPTVLSYLGVETQLVGWGQDLLTTPSEDKWAVCYSSGVYQYFSHDTLTLFDGEKVTATYRWREDSLLQHPLPQSSAHDERRLKAMIQSYMRRMCNNQLLPE